jgi:hypothetical protein
MIYGRRVAAAARSHEQILAMAPGTVLIVSANMGRAGENSPGIELTPDKTLRETHT